MEKQIAKFTERAEFLTKVMRGEISTLQLHHQHPDVMIEQPVNLHVRLKAVDLLARMHGDYVVRTEVTLSVDYAAELTRLKQLSDESRIEQNETLSFI